MTFVQKDLHTFSCRSSGSEVRPLSSMGKCRMVTRGWGAVLSIPVGEGFLEAGNCLAVAVLPKAKSLLDPDELPAGGLFDAAGFVDAGDVATAAASGADEPETHENGAIVS